MKLGLVVRRALGVALSTTGLIAAQRILDPAPLPAAGVLIGGLVAYVFGRKGAFLVGGALVGCLVGSALHAYSHVSEGRADAAIETGRHVLADAGVGLFVGSILLLLALAVDRGGRDPGVRNVEGSSPAL